MQNQLVDNLISFIDKSPSMFHATSSATHLLEAAGFTYLDPSISWNLVQGGKYYTTVNQSALIAFCINTTQVETQGFRIVGAHTDVPGFKVKPHPLMENDTYIKLNTQIYGGPILNTWLDRPLSLAGRVALKGKHPLKPIMKLVDLEEPILIIPNLAIHMNREVNAGVKLNAQKETLPILGYVAENLEESDITALIASKLGVNSDAILDMDLFLYPTEQGCLVGLNKQFISSSRLDDLSMVYSGIHGLIEGSNTSGINVLALFDNEEVGSRTKQGADSPILSTLLERIMLALGKTREDFFRALDNSFIISADVAHLAHPNYPEKSDPSNKVLPGKGPAIKVSASCSYTTDSDSYAVFSTLCQANELPFQVFVNRSDERGGSTIGPVSTAHLPIRSIDIGTPMLSMHSSRELMAAEDFVATCHVLKAFFSL